MLTLAGVNITMYTAYMVIVWLWLPTGWWHTWVYMYLVSKKLWHNPFFDWVLDLKLEKKKNYLLCQLRNSFLLSHPSYETGLRNPLNTTKIVIDVTDFLSHWNLYLIVTSTVLIIEVYIGISLLLRISSPSHSCWRYPLSKIPYSRSLLSQSWSC